MTFFNDDMSSEIEIEMLLTDLPIELIKENVNSQLSKIYGTVNYLNIVSDKLQLIEEQYDDPDIKRRVNDIRNEFFKEIIDIITEKFDINVNIDYSDAYQTENIAMDLYEFFIVENRKNTYKFLLNYIKENKKDIVETLNLSKPKKDVTTMSVRKKLKSIDVKIISNLYEVVDYIVNIGVGDDEFLEYSRNSSILDMYSNNTISGDIAAEFLSFSKEIDMISEVVPEIYSKLLGN